MTPRPVCDVDEVTPIHNFLKRRCGENRLAEMRDELKAPTVKDRDAGIRVGGRRQFLHAGFLVFLQ
jgi:hypothetical protein